uniref:RPN2_C domain-containing protein n=1 Tax=Heterorhabditis bacteriophora TaxID=37862 RepID=A0A1I7XKS9_HETBA
MLVEHFNSHVRYGAAMALGIACAGSGYKVNEYRKQLTKIITEKGEDSMAKFGAIIAQVLYLKCLNLQVLICGFRKNEPEPLTHTLDNPARVVRLQLKTLAMSDSAHRYKPVKSVSQGGIIMVLDRNPEDKEDLVAQVVAGGTTTDPVAPEKEPHSTFEIDISEL